MPTYSVEVRGEAREVYTVEADSEEEAMANWASGNHEITEVSSAEAVSAKVDE